MLASCDAEYAGHYHSKKFLINQLFLMEYSGDVEKSLVFIQYRSLQGTSQPIFKEY